MPPRYGTKSIPCPSGPGFRGPLALLGLSGFKESLGPPGPLFIKGLLAFLGLSGPVGLTLVNI